MSHVAVIDIGKTNAKVVLVDRKAVREIAVLRRANDVLPAPPYPHYDINGLWAFILSALKTFQHDHGIDAVTVTTHGASAVLLDAEGALAAPVLDYEFDGPDSLAADYDAFRPHFDETGSPRLPTGLNLGAQLFWQFRQFPEIREATRTIVTYPQYWAYRLTGIAVNELTSLGCHTDLWALWQNDFSSLVKSEGWEELMAPVAKAGDCLGPVLPEIAAELGLKPGTPVYCGIHDSNASLYAHLAEREAPFSVVSTGTWVISMSVGGKTVALDPAQDTLINVNAYGDPVPSARFMGGREFERLIGNGSQEFSEADIEAVLERKIMLLPAVESHSGPFQGRQSSWTVEEAKLSPAELFVAVSFYLALMTATGLELVGAEGPVLVEGPFANNRNYLDMLATVTGRPVKAVAGTGTSFGAALLVPDGSLDSNGVPPVQPRAGASWHRYTEEWRSLVVN